MFTSLRLAALALLVAGSVHAQTTTPDTPVPPSAPPAGTPTADAAAADKGTTPTINMEILTLPDGRKAVAFSGEGTLPPILPGFEKTTLPDGRTAYVLGQAAQPPLPNWAVEAVRLDDTRKVTYKTGAVTDKDAILTIPYVYRKLFRTTKDVMYKPIFSKTEKLDVPAGTLGFHAGHFRLGDYGVESAEMMCLLSGYDTGAPRASCYLVKDAGGPWLGVTTNGLVPSYYSVLTSYGNPMYANWGPPEIEEGDFTLPHDFNLTLRVTKWTDKGAQIAWSTDDGVVVKGDIVPPGTDREISFPIKDGKLVVSRGGDKHSTMVEFVPMPPAPESPAPEPVPGAN